MLHGTEVLSHRKPVSKVCKNYPEKEERKALKKRQRVLQESGSQTIWARCDCHPLEHPSSPGL